MHPGRQRNRVKARSLLCLWTVRELGMSSLTTVGLLEVTQTVVSRLAQKGEKLTIETSLHLENAIKG